MLREYERKAFLHLNLPLNLLDLEFNDFIAFEIAKRALHIRTTASIPY